MPSCVGIAAGVVCALALFAVPAAGQQTTEDGIRAMLRGDYPGAAHMLRPLADDEAKPDPVAQFFLAVLYETGLGVPRDMGRACGLFLRAGMREHPFREQSAAMAGIMRDQLGGASSRLCIADERWRSDPPYAAGGGTVTRTIDAPVSTAEGVLALARGDYQRAIAILKPIGEDWRFDDIAAQFFMAGLYESGRGVPLDPLRACALYARGAASNREHPFSRQADALFAALIGRSAEFNEECQLLFRVGFEHGFEPAVFDLGPGHFVEWGLAAASVTYEARTRRHEMPFAQPGARFLPLRHTELRSGPARTIARHFVEMFIWTPSSRSGPWQLHWHLFEIVRDDVIRVGASGPVVTVERENPPSIESFDVRDYAVLRVDEDGYPEWAVLTGPNAARQRIEPDSERREVRDAALARDAALKKTDWNRRDDVYRRPALTYADSDGCGHIEVYGWTTERNEAIVLRASPPDLPRVAQSVTYDLARDANISVEARVFAAPQHQFYSCTDVGMPLNPDAPHAPETWRAVAGTVTIEWSAPGVRARSPHLRRATVVLRDLVLRNTSGTTVKAPRPIRLTAIVGGFFG